MFILHGTAKFWEFPVSMTGGNGAVGDPLMIVGGIIEIVGSILLILGLFVRPAAFILSGQMAYAYFFMHVAGKGNLFFPIANGGELALFYSLVFFYFVFAGAGAFSLDNRKTLINYLINLLPAFLRAFFLIN